jgi:hypothetical protein
MDIFLDHTSLPPVQGQIIVLEGARGWSDIGKPMSFVSVEHIV